MTDQLAVDAAINLDNAWAVAVLRVRLGHSCLRAADDERALGNLYEAWKIVRFSNDPPLMHDALEGLVLAFERNGRHEDARLAAVDRDALARMLTAEPR